LRGEERRGDREDDRMIKNRSVPTVEHGREGDAKCDTVERSKEAVVLPKKAESKASGQDINESAEAFIKKFRQQLLIQRLESIENYEQMLARGL
jgi:PAB1-binding protein PBP1